MCKWFLPLAVRVAFIALISSAISISVLGTDFSAARAQVSTASGDGIQADAETLGLGLLAVSVRNNPRICNGKESLVAIAEAASALLLPLAESVAGEVGQFILSQSGKGKETMAMQGVATSHFFCIPEKQSKDEKQAYYLNPWLLELRSPTTSQSGGKSAFSARLRFEASADGSAYKIVPEEVSYTAPIMNKRAYGVVLQLTIQDLGKSSNSVIIPLGFTKCGRVNNVCVPQSDQNELISASSGWLPIPPMPSFPVASLAPTTDSRKSPLSTPITITVKLVEISTYDKFLAFLGTFLSANKTKVASVFLSTLPPLTQADRDTARSSARTSRANSAKNLVSYEVALRNYLRSVSDKVPCTSQIEAWTTAIDSAVTAGIDTELLSAPPSCVSKL